MQHVILFLVILTLSLTANSHQDTIIDIDGVLLKNLPIQYQPSILDLEAMYLLIGVHRLDFPSCVSKYFRTDSNSKVTAKASWYHEFDLLPPYITIEVQPKNRDYRFDLMFSLDTVRPIEFQVLTYAQYGLYNHEVKISERCRKQIESNVSVVAD